MEGSHLPIRTWLTAFSIMCSSKKGVSALQLQRQLGLGSYRTAWHLCHRIRHAMSQNPLKGLLQGVVMLPSYKGVGKWFEGGHETVNHAKFEFARGDVSTNEAESYFALLKRGITGSFHSVSKQHLHRYCNEFSFRWNERKVSDADRTAKALQLIGGGRLMYKDPIRKRAA